jgi:hypothetical protein
VYCLQVTFTVSRGGRSSITKHNESTKHKKMLEASALSQKVSSFFPNVKFLEDEKKIAFFYNCQKNAIFMHHYQVCNFLIDQK